MYLGDATSDARDTYLVQQLHALALAIGQAKDRNDKADAASLLIRFKALAEEYRNAGAGDMTAYDNFVLAVGDWIESSIDAIPGAIAALPVAVGKGLLMAAVPFIAMGLGYLLFKSATYNVGRRK